MQDRVSLYPGRVTLTPVSGQTNTYDMVRADSPTQEGTALNKASLLKDTTAALYGLTASAVPDDILNVLGKSAQWQISNSYTRHVGTNGNRPVGSTMMLNVDGTPREFIIVHQGKPSSLYDDSCSGTWLLMKDVYENRVWNSAGVNTYSSSTIHTYLNGTFLELFDLNIQSQIKQVKIPYAAGNGTTTIYSGSNGLPAKVFLLTTSEAGFPQSYNANFPHDGAKLDYFIDGEGGTATEARKKRIAKLNGEAAGWWLRAPICNADSSTTNRAWATATGGESSNKLCSSEYGVRPALILPSDSGEYIYYTDSDGNEYSEDEVVREITDVLGNLIQIPASQIKDGVKIATGSYTGTGTYGENSPNTLTFGFMPEVVIIKSGGVSTAQHQLGTGIIAPVSARASTATDYSIGVSFSYSGNPSLDTNIRVRPLKGHPSNLSISWYGGDMYSQLNASNVIYEYVALG